MTARVLIVDDSEELLENLEEILSAAGHEVRVATRPTEAIRVASDYAFDAALLDYRLPEMTGLELQRSLELIRPNARYFLMTGHADQWLRRAVVERDLAPFFEKPLPIDRMLEHLQSVRASEVSAP